MSEFSFRIPKYWNLNSYQLSLIHVVGIDGLPWPCKVRVDRESELAADGALVYVARNVEESGHVYFSYPHPGRGELLLSTGTLPVSRPPYGLLKELARGTLNRLRNQLSIWQEGGLAIPESITQEVRETTCLLGQSILCDPLEQQDRLAEQALNRAVDLIFESARIFGTELSRYRCRQPELDRFSLGITVGHIENISQFQNDQTDGAFEFFRVDPRVTEPARISENWNLNHELVVGPWLDASQGGMHRELSELADFAERRRQVLHTLESDLSHLPEEVTLLHLVSGINGIGHRLLSYPQQLQLTLDMLQRIDDMNVERPTMISFDFPWAERLAGAVGGIHPLQIADSLLRHGNRISYLGLEINLDYWPNGSLLRDPFQWVDLIDLWSQLEIPLVILLRAPLGGQPTPVSAPIDRLVNQQRSNVTDSQRAEFLKIVLPVLVARPMVHRLIWSQFRDEDDTRYPHAGLVDNNGHEKCTGQILRELGRQ